MAEAKRMRAPIIAGALVFFCVSFPFESEAAWSTRVLTAAEKRNAVDIDLDASFDRAMQNARIAREWTQNVNGALSPIDVQELEFSRTTQRILLELKVGLYHDLEFRMIAPIVLSEGTEISPAPGVESSSTISGSANADDSSHRGAARFPITGSSQERHRAGFGDMTFGLGWSPLVEAKDESYPTLTLRGDIIVPTGKTRDPSDPDAFPNESGGDVGLGQTTFDFSLGLSRRIRETTPYFDPYLLLGAQLPFATPAQKARGLDPPLSGRFTIGTELIVYDDPVEKAKFGFDVAFQTLLVGRGRTYSELSDFLPNFDQTKALQNRPAGSTIHPDDVVYSDFQNPNNYAVQVEGARCGGLDRNGGETTLVQGVPCGELNQVDEHLTMRGVLAMHLGLSDYLVFRGGASLAHTTDHFLTSERVGTDTDPASAATMTCNGTDCVGRVNAQNSLGQDERSPYFDPRYDATGRRFRIKDVVTYTFFVTGIATF